MAIDAGLRVESIPGPSAVLTALAASGVAGDTFSFLGFPPVRSKDRKLWFERLMHVGGTVVFFEAPHRIRRTLEEMHRTVGDCQVAVGRELTKKHEELVRGPITLALKALETPIGEFTVVIKFGHITDNVVLGVPGSYDLVSEFAEMTGPGRQTRRRAVATLARKHGLAPNVVYQALENVKKSVV